MTPKEPELLPCAHCGGEAELDSRRMYYRSEGRTGTSIAVYCVADCNADMCVCLEDIPEATPEMVIQMWNTRTDPSVSLLIAAMREWIKVESFAAESNDGSFIGMVVSGPELLDFAEQWAAGRRGR